MNMQYVAGGAVVAGVILVALSFAWPAVYDPQREWTDEDAKAYQETVARVHGGGELNSESEELKARFESAREKPGRIAGALKWSGAALVALGVVGLLVRRQRGT
jgi:hypothetical protein